MRLSSNKRSATVTLCSHTTAPLATTVPVRIEQAAMDQYNEEQGSAEAAGGSAAAAAAGGDDTEEEEQEEVEVKEVQKEKKHKKHKKEKAPPALAPESEEEASHCTVIL
jgi:hypothetical protein